MAKKNIKLYLHGNKDSLWDQGQEKHGFEPGSDAMDTFKRSLYEVQFNCVLDLETGEVEVESVDLGDGELYTK